MRILDPGTMNATECWWGAGDSSARILAHRSVEYLQRRTGIKAVLESGRHETVLRKLAAAQTTPTWLHGEPTGATGRRAVQDMHMLLKGMARLSPCFCPVAAEAGAPSGEILPTA
ncbi:hypothetical protein BP5796_09854 [Coleophoma crateriformis]|uniref:Uncharacterized protein n=1 Tax=Coleophoma crateriformis TaxID=565419 RepID=A0A3D8QTR8_9HELO|nr:hypothetical protein BP5796_09854 [Coleophoma crateriformis]